MVFDISKDDLENEKKRNLGEEMLKTLAQRPFSRKFSDYLIQNPPRISGLSNSGALGVGSTIQTALDNGYTAENG